MGERVNKYSRWLALGLLTVSLMAPAWAGNGADAIVGTWLIQDGSAKVQITDSSGIFSGRVVWLKEPMFPANDSQGMAGKPKTDRLNPDAALRSRPIMGLTLLSDLHYVSDGTWEGGVLYSPATGKSYACKASLAADGTLKLSVGGSVFGRTSVWTHASADIPGTK